MTRAEQQADFDAASGADDCEREMRAGPERTAKIDICEGDDSITVTITDPDGNTASCEVTEEFAMASQAAGRNAIADAITNATEKIKTIRRRLGQPVFDEGGKP